MPRAVPYVTPVRRRSRRAALCLVGLVAALVCALVPAAARADICPGTGTDASYTGACGPAFATPAWADAGGWTDPSQYGTIDLVDVNGDGSDELIGRSAQGLEIWRFDTDAGQWRPQVDADDFPQVLQDFASPPPEAGNAHNPALAGYSSTIQAADIDGQPGEEILARFWDGMRVYKYVPPPASGTGPCAGKPTDRCPDGGTWQRIGTGGPFSDSDGWTDPSLYLTIKTADVDGDDQAELVSRTTTGAAIYTWTGSGWATDGSQLTYGLFGNQACQDVSCYLTVRPFEMPGGSDQLLAVPDGGVPASQQGAQLAKRPAKTADWVQALPDAQSPQDPMAGPFSSQPGWPDCTQAGVACLNQSPAYYETMLAADVDGAPGDELLGLLMGGLQTKKLQEEDAQTTDDADPSLNYIDGWSHATNSPGAFDGTLSTSTERTLVTWNGGVSDKSVAVIGPKGPGLGTMNIAAFGDGANTKVVAVDLSAPTRLDQQVLFEFSAPGGNIALQITADWNNTIAIDAIKHGAQVESKWTSLATVPAAGGDPDYVVIIPGTWGSVRTGNIDGTGGDEVLALGLDGKGLDTWSYSPADDEWTELQPSTPLALTGQDWLTKPEYFSTIRVGDVDGDGRDDVVARGPVGVRTWFYNRRKTGGWERYLPEGYPDFPGTPPTKTSEGTGEAAAYGAVTTKAKNEGLLPVTVQADARNLWASENPPTDDQLFTFRDGMPKLFSCTGGSVSEPTEYQTCTPATTAYTPEELTTVVNTLVAEAYWAENVVDHFDVLQTILDKSMPQNGTALKAIAADLSLQAATDSTTPSQFNGNQLWSVISGIAGSIAGLAEPELGAGLAIASYVFSTLPSASPSATSTFPSTYADLDTKFATMTGEMQAQHDAQSQLVRQDAGLVKLVGQLRASGTWTLDSVGMESASNQGFATWVYKTLTPTIYHEFDIYNCSNRDIGVDVDNELKCSGPAGGPGVLGGGSRFITIMSPPGKGSPCSTAFADSGLQTTCTWNLPPANLLDIIWGPLDEANAPNCVYTPGDATRKWTYGCPLGVDEGISLGANTWNFPYHQGRPIPNALSASAPKATQARVKKPIVLGRPKSARRPAVRGRAKLDADVYLPARLRLARATVRLDRMLFERRGRAELTRVNGRRLPRRASLRPAGGGRFVASATAGRRHVRVELRRTSRGRTRLTLTAGARAFKTPQACHALPAGVALRAEKLQLRTRVRISDGRHNYPIVLSHRLRCARDSRANVNRLVPVRPRNHPSRPGLAVTLHGDRVVEPGSLIGYVARVHNRRRGGTRASASLRDVMVSFGTRTRDLGELRRGRSRAFSFNQRVPSTARGRFCVTASASAAGARPAHAERCLRVVAPQAACSTSADADRARATRCAAVPPADRLRVTGGAARGR